MTVTQRFEFGDRVRHAKRPEWGVGSVIKAEEVRENGTLVQRLSIRFSGAGIKSLITGHADLERVAPEGEPEDAAVGGGYDHERDAAAFWAMVDTAQWLAPVTERKVLERMTALPEAARDPFRSIHDRIAFTLGLYRFDRSGRGLVDWSVAQSGLADPLVRFNRHQLEQWYERWAGERDAHLRRLLSDGAVDAAEVKRLLAGAPRDAQAAARRR